MAMFVEFGDAESLTLKSLADWLSPMTVTGGVFISPFPWAARCSRTGSCDRRLAILVDLGATRTEGEVWRSLLGKQTRVSLANELERAHFVG